MFSKTSEVAIFEEIVSYCQPRKGGPLGTASIVLIDDNGEKHIFTFESFHFYYQTLTLGIYSKPKTLFVAA